MKKSIAVVLLLCLLPLFAMAEMNEDGCCVIALPETEIVFTPIEDAYLLTQESSASAFRALGASQRELVPWMEQYGIYAMLMDMNWGWELHVQIYSSQSKDYDSMSEAELQIERESLAADYHERGYKVLSCDQWNAPDGHVYMCIKVVFTHDDGREESSMELMTAQNGWGVSVYMFSYHGELTTEQETLTLELANSLRIKPMQ